MRKMRARAFALRDGWPDYLKGMHSKEELEGETIELQPSKNGKFERAEQGPEDLKAKLQEAPIILDKPQSKPEPEKDPDPDDDPDGTKTEILSSPEQLRANAKAFVDAVLNEQEAAPATKNAEFETGTIGDYKDLEELVKMARDNIKILNYPADCEINEPGWSTIATYPEDDLLTGKQFLTPVSGFPGARLVRFLSGSNRMMVRLQGGADVEKPGINNTTESTKVDAAYGNGIAEFINKAEAWGKENCASASVFMKTFSRYLAYVADIRNQGETAEDMVALAAGPDTVAENWFKKALEWDKVTVEREDEAEKNGKLGEADPDMGRTQEGKDVIDLSEGAQESEAHDEIRDSIQYKDYDPLAAEFINRYSKAKLAKICDLLDQHKIDYAPSWPGGKLHATLKEGAHAPQYPPADGGTDSSEVEKLRYRIREFKPALVEKIQVRHKMAVGFHTLPSTVGGCKNLLNLLIAETS
jgi:hypothetical protein